MDVTALDQCLTALGFKVQQEGRTECVRRFQLAWALGPTLAVDGIVGPKTDAALRTSWGRHKSGLATMSKWFSFREVACHCGGTYQGCAQIWTRAAFVKALDAARDRVGTPIVAINWYRCPKYNAKVGGAKASMHLHGLAIDWRPGLSASTVHGWHLFSGIEWVGSPSNVTHVDGRHLTGSGYSPQTPCIFEWRG